MGKKNGEFAGTCASQSPFSIKTTNPVDYVEKCLRKQIVKIQHPSTIKKLFVNVSGKRSY